MELLRSSKNSSKSLGKWILGFLRSTVYSFRQQKSPGIKLDDSISPIGLRDLSELPSALDRAKERHRRIGMSALVSIFARAATALSALISIPLTLNYLAPERFGLWMTISSFVTFFGFAELGLGYGLLNAIAECHGKNNRSMAREFSSSAFFSLLSIAGIISIVAVISYRFLPWGRMFNVASELAIREAGPATVAFLGCFVVGIPLSVARRIRMGYQEDYINSFWEGCGAILGLAGLWISVKLQAGLPWLVLCLTGGPMLSLLVNNLKLFLKDRQWLCPSWRSATASGAKRILKTGLMFFVMQISYAITFTSDNFVISQFLGPQGVTDYSVPVRLFSIVQVLIGLLLAPLWPAYGEAIARGDMGWIRSTLRKSIIASLVLATVFSVAMIFFGSFIISVWVGADFITPKALLFAIGVWTIVWACVNSIGTFLNGIGAMKLQMFCSLGAAGIALAGKLILLPRLGLPSVVWSTVLANVVFMLIPYAIKVPVLIHRLGTESVKG